VERLVDDGRRERPRALEPGGLARHQHDAGRMRQVGGGARDHLAVEVRQAQVAQEHVGAHGLQGGQGGRAREEGVHLVAVGHQRELEERPNSPLWMSAQECGERVLAGIRRDDLYIFTHREFREGADERFRAMLASFPDEPLDTERADAIRFLLSNPIFAGVLERRSS